VVVFDIWVSNGVLICLRYVRGLKSWPGHYEFIRNVSQKDTLCTLVQQKYITLEKLGSGNLNKSEAQYTIHEILVALRDKVTVEGFSLIYSNSKGISSKSTDNVSIKLNCIIDEKSILLIQPILDRRKLKKEILKDHIIICS
jgi:hypothetical protein